VLFSSFRWKSAKQFGHTPAMLQNWKSIFVVFLLAGAVSGCSAVDGIWSQNPALTDKSKSANPDHSARRSAGSGGVAESGINAYLWRASLDTISFMPLASADPFGGIIITDWYAPPETPNERFKLTVYILSRDLRADGLRVTTFRQMRNRFGAWSDAEVNPKTIIDIENNILTRARQLRINQATRTGE